MTTIIITVVKLLIVLLHTYTHTHTLRAILKCVFLDDDVYMEDEDEKFEYVLNETGRIWQGTARNKHGEPWNFGQVRD